MFVIVRAVTYATLFIAFFLVALPAQVLARYGVTAPPVGAAQLAGIALTVAGAAITVACVLAFARLGRGTPAPFDPPQRLVTRGPYAVIRNPMYVGAVLALAGASLYYASWPLLIYALGFLIAAHLIAVLYEEPTLRRTFGAEYEAYCKKVGRWWPRKAPEPELSR
jgi:protein-S-isoprenylcysteine O-methyltransferase Ste14